MYKNPHTTIFLLIKTEYSGIWQLTPAIPPFGRETGYQEFNVILGYILSSRTAWATAAPASESVNNRPSLRLHPHGNGLFSPTMMKEQKQVTVQFFFLFFLFPLWTKCHGIYKLHKTIHVVQMIISYSKTNENDVNQVTEVINRQLTPLWKSGLASQYSLPQATVSQKVRSKAPQKIFAPGF